MLGAAIVVVLVIDPWLARSFGFVFDPLTVFWCIRPDGDLACVVAEVRNTYGERHCYLAHPDETGVARIEKAFYVSPFVKVEGSYDMRFILYGTDVGVSIVLHQQDEVLFVATFRGRAAPATRWRRCRRCATHAAVRAAWRTRSCCCAICVIR